MARESLRLWPGRDGARGPFWGPRLCSLARPDLIWPDGGSQEASGLATVPLQQWPEPRGPLELRWAPRPARPPLRLGRGHRWPAACLPPARPSQNCRQRSAPSPGAHALTCPPPPKFRPLPGSRASLAEPRAAGDGDIFSAPSPSGSLQQRGPGGAGQALLFTRRGEPQAGPARGSLPPALR